MTTIDARLNVEFPTHPKTVKLMRRVGKDGAWSLVCLFLWTAANRPSGDLFGMTAEDIEIAAGWEGEHEGLIDALLAVGYLERAGEGFRMHDWEEHNPWAAGAQARSDKARKAQLIRDHGKEKGEMMFFDAQQRKHQKASESHQNASDLSSRYLVDQKTDLVDGKTDLQDISEISQGSSPLLSFPILSSPNQHQKTLAQRVERKPASTAYTEQFLKFWKAYPRPDGKAAAQKSWTRQKLDSLADTIIADVLARKSGAAWKEEGGKFIPHGSTYLNNRRWEDGPAADSGGGGYSPLAGEI